MATGYGRHSREPVVLFTLEAFAVSLLLPALAQAAFLPLQLQTISSGELNTPIGMAAAGDGSGRLFIIDQRGRIDIIQNGSLLPTPFLDLGSKLVPQRTNASGAPSFDERGLLGLAFHPDYAVPNAPGQGKFYVFYSAPSADPGTPENPINCVSRVSEFKVSAGNPNVADPTSERILMAFNKPQFNHNGGQISFGPDRMLYISTGDGGGSNDNDPGHTGGSALKPNGPGVLGNAQDRSNLMGNILRIDVNTNNGPNGQYGIPANNPFVGQAGVREEIYAYGMRNPWRFSFDDGPGGDGRLFVADVGQGLYEEVNIVQSGGNYGWRLKEGFHDFDPTSSVPDGPLLDPIAEYSHPNAPDGTKIGLATVGGYIYRGNLIPGLQGKYIFGDWSTSFSAGHGTLLGLEEVSPGTWQLTTLDIAGGNPIPYFINSFGRDEDGELYVLANLYNQPNNLHGGLIFKIVPEPSSGLLILSLIGAWGLRKRGKTCTHISA